MKKRIEEVGLLFFLCTFIAAGAISCRQQEPYNQRQVRDHRRVISLNGTWDIGEGGLDRPPASFGHRVAVPGLVSLAEPAFSEVGIQSERREAFWYRRSFKLDAKVPEVAVLKVHKAKYGTKVFVNGSLAGEHLPCFTPGLFDVKEHLKGRDEENELLICVGANRESVPEAMPRGWDFEKHLYIPGIYDSVDLILAGSPYIVNVQTVPDIDKGEVRVVAEIDNIDWGDMIGIDYQVREAATGKIVADDAISIDSRGRREVRCDFNIRIPNCRLWSPEDPFLYEVRLVTSGDAIGVRFGMRSFRFDKESGQAVLNGKPYFMRGTNVCIYRFFEDSERGDKPWRTEWVRRLHQKFKSMEWNTIRYCIGFPPEIWYEIADEEGFLIQDEFPIWLLDRAPERPESEKIIPEYIEWMRERWNHPCVVIWDAQNESVTNETGKAIQAVRHLDLSNRPWENGWAEPQSPNDCVESHPYLFIKEWLGEEPFQFSDIANISGAPYLREEQKKHNVPVINNEYGWLWLNRDGSVTQLTEKIYENFFRQGSTTEQRRVRYARYLAALTEFWRCHRKCAGVLHFCGLGYSRPDKKPLPEGGATSDNFRDMETLEFESRFEQYVKDSFSPVGLMVNFWAEEVESGDLKLEVYVINDLYEDWSGEVTLRLVKGEATVSEKSQAIFVKGLGREILSYEVAIPLESGQYQFVAGLINSKGETIESIRDFRVN
ncbi:MAG: glycoside hydrolase family 2 TIM barrel-domain containing protein [Planctomycetota bacterium]|jgi:hypothetical protein